MVHACMDTYVRMDIGVQTDNIHIYTHSHASIHMNIHTQHRLASRQSMFSGISWSYTASARTECSQNKVSISAQPKYWKEAVKIAARCVSVLFCLYVPCKATVKIAARCVCMFLRMYVRALILVVSVCREIGRASCRERV